MIKKWEAALLPFQTPIQPNYQFPPSPIPTNDSPREISVQLQNNTDRQSVKTFIWLAQHHDHDHQTDECVPSTVVGVKSTVWPDPGVGGSPTAITLFLIPLPPPPWSSPQVVCTVSVSLPKSRRFGRVYKRRRTLVSPLKLKTMATAMLSVDVIWAEPVFWIHRTMLKGMIRIAFESGYLG